MSGLAHIAPERLAGLALLDTADAERIEAESHARECEPCRRALTEAARTMALLDAMPPPPPPSEAALRRALDAVHAEMQVVPATAHVARAWARPLLGVLALATWAISLLLARHRDDGAMPLSLVGALVAGAGALVTMARDRLALGLLLGASVILAGSAAGEAGLFPQVGVWCSLHELACAALPLAGAAWLARSGRVTVGPLSLAAAAGAGAVAGQAALHVACPVAHAAAHLGVFHVGGVLLSALAGAALSRTLRLRRA